MVSMAMQVPRAHPARTSVGQCTPRTRRLTPIAPASSAPTTTGIHLTSGLRKMNMAVASAIAKITPALSVAWPEGNEASLSATRWRETGGRALPKTPFTTSTVKPAPKRATSGAMATPTGALRLQRTTPARTATRARTGAAPMSVATFAAESKVPERWSVKNRRTDASSRVMPSCSRTASAAAPKNMAEATTKRAAEAVATSVSRPGRLGLWTSRNGEGLLDVI